jgi:hypothetical protein
MLWLSLAILLLFVTSLLAQEAIISGLVLRRGVVPMVLAHVRYTSPDNAAIYDAQTDSAGHYRISGIALSVPEQSRPQQVGFASFVTNSVGASRSFYFSAAKPLKRAHIFDILGREVAAIDLKPEQLTGVWISSGSWNGVGSSGTPVADGIYFASVLEEPKLHALKFVHLRGGAESAPPVVSGSILQTLADNRVAAPSRHRAALDDPFTVTICQDTSGTRFATREFVRELRDGDNGEFVDTVWSAVPHRILFVGNSYTYVNGGVDLHLMNLMRAARPDSFVQTTAIAQGGFTLGDHWLYNPTRTAISSGDWDVVVLQEQSQRPVLEPDSFYYFARLLNGEILRTYSETAFYMTWARQDDPPMIEPLAAAYDSMGRALGAQVAPCGRAFQRVAQEDTSIHLYDTDGSHPSVWGTYLAGCVFYATLVHESPEGIPYVSDPQITEAQRDYLQTVAWETVHPIP